MGGIKKGYKQTECGILPEDWGVKALGDIAQIQRGASPRPIDSPIWFEENSQTGWLRISDVSKAKKYLFDTVQNLSNAGIENSRFVPRNSLVMSICATVGRPILTKKDVCIHDGFVVFKNLQANINYLYYLLLDLEKNWGKHGQTGSQMNLNTDLINITKIPLPPTLEEQEKIATVLSDMDDYIQSLEGLITKKGNIKQGTMQRLLNPFDANGDIKEGWEKKYLGDIAPLQRGFDLPKSQIKCGNIPIAYSNGIMGYHNKSMVKGPGVYTGRSGTIGKVNFIETDYWPHNTSLWVTSFNNNDPKFIYYLYTHINFNRFSSGSGVPTFNRNDAHIYECIIPPHAQQKKIATILSDMDAEIEALETKLSKAKDIKQGMMQKLLTGQIRLVDAELQKEELAA